MTNPSNSTHPQRRRRRGRGRPSQARGDVAIATSHEEKTATPEGQTPAPAPSKQRNRRRRQSGWQGEASKATKTAGRAAPATKPKKRPARRPTAHMPHLGVGCVVLSEDRESILMVRERGRWDLPKGGLEPHELLPAGARREVLEETGYTVELQGLAFILEMQARSWGGHHLQFYYLARVQGGELRPQDPDGDIQEAAWVPLVELSERMRFRPRAAALQSWLSDRQPRHFLFNNMGKDATPDAETAAFDVTPQAPSAATEQRTPRRRRR